MIVSLRKMMVFVCLLLAAPAVMAQSDVTQSDTKGDENSDGPQAVRVLEQYFDLLSSSNFETASEMWTPEVLERNRRFGITFDNIPVQVDCTSQIIRNLDRVRFDLIPAAQHWRRVAPTWYELTFNRLAAGVNINQRYYLAKRGNWFWFSYPQDLYASNWNQVESRYLRLHVDPAVESFVNPVTLRVADQFVDDLCDSLGLSGAQRSEIADKKIEYFYCSDDTVVQKLTGQLTKGMLFQPTSDIISAVLPHCHEITHLLVNIKLKNLPLMTLPLLREGIAVHYGGRWGRGVCALNQLSVFLYRENLVSLDSILTYRGFQDQAGADIVYPAAGVFVGYLLDRLGQDEFFRLYRAMSGSESDLYDLSADDIKTAFTAALKLPGWDAVTADFAKYLADEVVPSFAAEPGTVKKGKPRIVGDGYKITEDRDWLGFEFTVPPDSGKYDGNLVFAPEADLKDKSSSLFLDQYPEGDIHFEGYRYGVRFDQNEAGLYDYVTNQLVAKYIWGITPSDDYFNKDTGTIAIKFRKRLVGDELPSAETCQLLAR